MWYKCLAIQDVLDMISKLKTLEDNLSYFLTVLSQLRINCQDVCEELDAYFETAKSLLFKC
jgi:hypothetical protein